MIEKKSFLEIVKRQPLGEWYYNGLIVQCSQDVFDICPLYGKNKITDVYTVVDITTPLFVQVIRREFHDAIKELIDNKRIIRSPFFREGNNIKVKGGNIFEPLDDGKIKMNNTEIFNSFDEILQRGLIQGKEKEGYWSIF